MRSSFVARVVIGVAFALVTLVAVPVQAQSDEPLTDLQIAAACSIPAEFGPPNNALHVIGGQDTARRSLFGSRELIAIDGGTNAGVALGQRYFTRRSIRFGGGSPDRRPVPRTSGWIRVVAVNETTAIASIEVACDGLMAGDYLEPFAAPMLPPDIDRVDTSGEPDFSNLGRVLFGLEARRTAVGGDFVLIDRGTEDGVMPGARFAVYRDLRVPGLPLASLGEGIVVTTTGMQSVMRILTSRDAVESGDYVVPRK